jgi:hypothetical protein
MAEQVYPMSFLLQCQPYLFTTTPQELTQQHNHSLSWGFASKNKHIAEVMYGSLIMLFYFKTSSLDAYSACKRGEMRGTNKSDALYGKRH